jgi:hypothetical protein
MLKPKKLNSMTLTTRIGKIGRSPKPIRDELGQRIENGNPSGQNVAGCCHPVAENVATLIPDHQRCNGCCHFSDFISVLITIFDMGWIAQAPRLFRSAPRRPERGEAPSMKLPAQRRPSKASVTLFTPLTRSDGNNTKTHKNTQLNTNFLTFFPHGPAFTPLRLRIVQSSIASSRLRVFALKIRVHRQAERRPVHLWLKTSMNSQKSRLIKVNQPTPQ